MERIEGGLIGNDNKINDVLQEVSLIKEKVDNISAGTGEYNIHANEINQNELSDPLFKKVTRGKISKKLYRKCVDVACKPIDLQVEDPKEAARIQGHLAILGKLQNSPHIIKFFGLSYSGSGRVLVLEWAEHGSLKDLYNKYDIKWHGKVRMALEICRGLSFLHNCNVLHHDIRCENIMVKI